MTNNESTSRIDIATSWDSNWLINGSRQEDDMEEYLRGLVDDQLEGGPDNYCPYCGHRLRHKTHKHYEGDGKLITHIPQDELITRHYILSICYRCSYWTMTGNEVGSKCMDPTFLMTAASVVAKFSTDPPHGCSEELAQHLRRNPNLWHSLGPTRLETLMVDILKSNHRHCEVKHVGGPGDLGVDVLFIDDNEKKWLIQVKRRSKPKKAEGFSTLQSILGTLALQGERHGIIVSTADYFSYQAKRETQNAAKQGYTIKLFDKGILDRMVGSLLPRSPWLTLFDHPDVANIIKDLRTNFIKPYDTIGVGKVADIDLGGEKVYVSRDPNQLTLFSD